MNRTNNWTLLGIAFIIIGVLRLTNAPAWALALAWITVGLLLLFWNRV